MSRRLMRAYTLSNCCASSCSCCCCCWSPLRMSTAVSDTVLNLLDTAELSLRASGSPPLLLVGRELLAIAHLSGARGSTGGPINESDERVGVGQGGQEWKCSAGPQGFLLLLWSLPTLCRGRCAHHHQQPL